MVNRNFIAVSLVIFSLFSVFAADVYAQNSTNSTNTTNATACRDTDSSSYPTINYNMTGSVLVSGVVASDNCLDSARLREYYCSSPNSTSASNVIYTCPNGCSNNACKMQNATDTTPPTVSVSHSPLNPYQGQNVTFTASASDNVGLNTLWIFVDNYWTQICRSYSALSGSCKYMTSNLSAGNHTYYAIAIDTSGNSASTSIKQFKVGVSGGRKQIAAEVPGNNIIDGLASWISKFVDKLG